MMPRTIFVTMIAIMVFGATCSEMNIGSISSDVERNTAISVPTEITPPAKRLDAAAENPHWGSIPAAPPISGPKRPAFSSMAVVLFSVLCSIYSMAI